MPGGYEYRNRKIALRYVTSGWFYLDTVSVLPFDLFSIFVFKAGGEGAESKLAVRIPRLLKVLRLPRVWKMFKLLRLFRTFKFLAKHPLVAEIVDSLQLNEWILQLL